MRQLLLFIGLFLRFHVYRGQTVGSTSSPNGAGFEGYIRNYIRQEVDRLLQEKIQQEVDSQMKTKFEQELASRVQEEVDRQIKAKVEQEVESRVKQAVKEALTTANVARASEVALLRFTLINLITDVDIIRKCDPCRKIDSVRNLITAEDTSSTKTLPTQIPNRKYTTEAPNVKNIRPTIVTTVPSTSRTSPRPRRPVMDLDLKATNKAMSELYRVAALPGGGAAVYNFIRKDNTRQVIRVNEEGATIHVLYSCRNCNNIGGLLVVKGNIYVLHQNGTIVEIKLQNSQILNTYYVEVGRLIHTGSLSSGPDDQIRDPDLLLLCDSDRGEVFTYSLSRQVKQVRVTGLIWPVSVTYSSSADGITYIVCETDAHSIKTYSATWRLIRTFGGLGSRDGQLSHPNSAVMSNEGTILVADSGNDRISEFTRAGRFLRQVLINLDGVYRPAVLSFSHPHIWILTFDTHNIKRFMRHNSII